MRHVIFFGGAKCSAEQVVSTALSSLFVVTNSAHGSVCATDDADNGSVLRFGHERVVLGRFALNPGGSFCVQSSTEMRFFGGAGETV